MGNAPDTRQSRSASDTITLSDAMPALAWTPPGKPDTIAMSGRVELPDPDEARLGYGRLMGGTLLTLALTLALIPVALSLQSYQIAMVGGALLAHPAWPIPGSGRYPLLLTAA